MKEDQLILFFLFDFTFYFSILKSVMHKKIVIRKIEDFFRIIQNHHWYRRFHAFPLVLKILIAMVLFVIGILGIILPILPGLIFIFLGLILLFGIHRVQSISMRLIYLTRIHILYTRFLLWWKRK